MHLNVCISTASIAAEKNSQLFTSTKNRSMKAPASYHSSYDQNEVIKSLMNDFSHKMWWFNWKIINNKVAIVLFERFVRDGCANAIMCLWQYLRSVFVSLRHVDVALPFDEIVCFSACIKLIRLFLSSSFIAKILNLF